jgi:hypothetical protein
MRSRPWTNALTAAALAATMLAGCQTMGPKPAGGELAAAPGVENDVAGKEALEGVVKITALDDSKLVGEGVVTYTLENVSDQHQENLLYYVLFYYPPEAKQLELGFEFDSAATNEQALSLFRGRAKTLTIANPKWEGKGKAGPKVLGTKLTVLKDEFVPTVPRFDDAPGTKFVAGALECVALADDELYTKPPSFWIELENTSGRTVANYEINVIFMELDGRTEAGQSGWQPLPTIRPGETKKKVVRLDKVKKVRPDFWVKIRTREL